MKFVAMQINTRTAANYGTLRNKRGSIIVLNAPTMCKAEFVFNSVYKNQKGNYPHSVNDFYLSITPYDGTNPHYSQEYDYIIMKGEHRTKCLLISRR